MVDLTTFGLVAILAGIVMVALALFLSHPAEEGETQRTRRIRGGGVVMIGPIPIIFGSDARWAVIAIVLAIALILLSLILTSGMVQV